MSPARPRHYHPIPKWLPRSLGPVPRGYSHLASANYGGLERKVGLLRLPYHVRRSTSLERRKEQRIYDILKDIDEKFPPGSTEAPGAYGEMARKAHAWAEVLAMALVAKFAFGRQVAQTEGTWKGIRTGKVDGKEETRPNAPLGPDAWKQALRFAQGGDEA